MNKCNRRLRMLARARMLFEYLVETEAYQASDKALNDYYSDKINRKKRSKIIRWANKRIDMLDELRRN